jgi:hypothetical protein
VANQVICSHKTGSHLRAAETTLESCKREGAWAVDCAGQVYPLTRCELIWRRMLS